MPLFMRRKRYLVQHHIQLRFARFMVVFVLLSCFVTGLTIFYTVFAMLGEKLALVYPQGRLTEIVRWVYLILIINMLVVLPVIFYCSIVFSHRVAGPLSKMYDALTEIGKGNFNVHIFLRKHDQLKDLADVIEEMEKNLKERDAKK